METIEDTSWKMTAGNSNYDFTDKFDYTTAQLDNIFRHASKGWILAMKCTLNMARKTSDPTLKKLQVSSIISAR